MTPSETAAASAESDSGQDDRPPAGGVDDSADRARQLHEQGLGIRDVAILLNVHEAQVQRWIATADHEAAAEAHRAAWSSER